MAEVALKTTPYWWDDAPRPAGTEASLPMSVDVLVIGSGYTGLAAAIETQRAGRSTLVIDAGGLGEGCSSRNGGQVSTSIKPSYSSLRGRHNEDIAFRVRREGFEALAFLRDFIARERLDCDWRQVGRFHAAHTPKHYEELAHANDGVPKELRSSIEMVPRAEVHRELASDRYHGGAVMPKHAAVHPAKLHNELVRLARTAGANLLDRCVALSIERTGAGFRVATGRGVVEARDVLVATNGYTGALTPWLRRRIIPIGSYILATEPLPEADIAAMIPNDRVVSDTRRVVIYFRSSPDRRRILFGGRAALAEHDPARVLGRLEAMARGVLPRLGGVRSSHIWVGFVAYTFDALPHIGRHDGLHYAMGYCGSGVSLAVYFGTRIGQRVLGRKEGATALDDLAFETRPLYAGRPWFLAPSVLAYRVLDRIGL